MPTALMPEGRQRYHNNDGTPCAGGKLYTYAAGTTNPKVTYTDEAGTVAHPNPITLDAKGEAVIYWSGAYKIDLKQADGTQVTGYPVDNVKTDPAGLWNILTTLAASAGAALIGFIQAGAGAILRTIASKLREEISLADFLTDAQKTAIANGSYDAALVDAVEAAVVAAAGRTIKANPGAYIFGRTAELNWSTSAASVYQPATRIIADGPGVVQFINRSGGPAFQHSVTAAQAAAGCRFWGGELRGFTVTTDGGSPAGSSGIRLFSYWFGSLRDMSISGVKGNAIETPANTALSANPDNYACGALSVRNVNISSPTGKGIFSSTWSNTWRIKDCYIINCPDGGIDLTGAGHVVDGGAVSACGINSLYAIRFNYGNNAGTPHNCKVRGVELDNNYGTHVWVEGYSHVIEYNRYIQDAQQGPGGNTFRNTTCVLLDATASGSAANIIVRGGLVRLDNAGAATLTAFKVVDAAGAQNNRVEDVIFTSAAGLTKYSFPSGRVRNYAIENGVQVAGGGQQIYSPGQTAVVYCPSSTILKSAPVQIPLAAAVDSNGRVAGNALTMDYDGVLQISFNMVFRPITTASVAANVYIYKNGAQYHPQPIPQGFSSLGNDTGHGFPLTLKVSKGDVITLWASVATNDTLYVISSGTATTTFKML